MIIKLIPVHNDNYSYLIIDEVTRQAAVIDPAEPGPVLDAITSAKVTLTAILCTHHHWDHSGGNKELLKHIPGIDVVGGEADSHAIPGCTRPVHHGDTLKIGDLIVEVLHVPCHTRGHVAYLVEDALFTGDTLFVGGCGRFFEGTPEHMNNSLNHVIANLSDSTRIFCGHEYSLETLSFALTLEPSNQALRDKLEWAKNRTFEGLPTVPSTIGEEKEYNPFMRVHTSEIAAAVGLTGAFDPVDVMYKVRKRKDSFRF